MIARRTFLRSVGASLVTASVLPALRARATGLNLVPVDVDPRRVIRTIVGLRPFRSSGFVLRAQAFGNKMLVHDYGHGGGGFSLSWGTATLACDLAAGRTPGTAAVIGCGVIGLSTARILQDRGWRVTIYAERVPPNTTSNVAGAQWFPTSVFDRTNTTPAFMQTYQNAARIANRVFQTMLGTYYGVRWIDNYSLLRTPQDGDEITNARDFGIADLIADVETIDTATTPFAAPVVRRFTTMLIEPNTYLPAVMRDFLLRGGQVRVRRFESLQSLAQLDEPVIFNCTGLGARDLVGDTELMPIRGQLTFLEPQPEVNYITLGQPVLYMFPRTDGILLGGTFDRGNWSLDPDLAVEKRILAQHSAIYRR